MDSALQDTAPLKIGTRASALALAQSGEAGEAVVSGTGREVELVHVRTQGDVDRTSPLAQIGGTGVFVTAVRRALLEKTVDVIVHSCKDLPTTPEPGIAMACIPPREDPRDALCSRDGLRLDELPDGASIGTGSPRRAAQLLRHRPDLHVVAIRGNIETRLARAQGAEADLDAVVLAAAGLRRLGREAAISELLPVDVMLPAPAQGALALEVREGTEQDWYAGGLARLEDADTRAAITAERALLRRLEAGCSAPVAAYAQLLDGRLILRGLAIAPDGRSCVEAEASGSPEAAEQLGIDLAETLLDRGAGAILEAARS